jgi:hypothetical protein
MRRKREVHAWLMVLLLAALPGLVGAAAPPAPSRLEALERDTARSFRAAQKDIDALKEEVARLGKEVAELRKEQRHVTRRPLTSASIRLVNAYAEPMQVIVNGTTYRLAPGEARLLSDQRPGAFTYEVLGVQEPVKRVLDPYETFTIRIRPR